MARIPHFLIELELYYCHSPGSSKNGQELPKCTFLFNAKELNKCMSNVLKYARKNYKT